MQFGQQLWICPVGNKSRSQAVNVLLTQVLPLEPEPTTTALCLHWLAQQDVRQHTIVDYGCGSRILAIAALKLGAKQTIGVDIDPQALHASDENAKRNQVQACFTTCLPEQAPVRIQADLSSPTSCLALYKHLPQTCTVGETRW